MQYLTSDERAILKAAKETPKTEQVFVDTTLKPYKNIFYSNKNLTVVFKDGAMLSKSGVDHDTFYKVRDAQTEAEINTVMIDISKATENLDKVETPQERQLVSENLEVLSKHPDFVVYGGQVTLKGVNLPMPASVIASFIEILEKQDAIPLFHEISQNAIDASQNMVDLHEQYQALKMFWLKLALNTLPQSREDLLIFCKKNDVRITRNGNLILYRRIVTKSGADTQLVTFITQNYYQIKKEGNDPREFAIAMNTDGYILINLTTYDGSNPQPFLNLQLGYMELPTFETNSFTSAHDKNVEIKLGGIYKIPDNKINLKNTICSAGGLHAAAVDYNYSGFGDMPVVVLVNPSKAITVPMNETGKLRTTEMFVACVNDKPIGTHFDESALSAFDSEYHDFTLFELEEAAKTKSFEKLSVQETVPAVSLVDLNTIKEMLKERIKDVF
jgi:hypothetical protein